jgi:hypothetical protein
MSLMTLGSVGLSVDRLDAHLLHRGGDMTAADARKVLPTQDVTQPSGPLQRVFKTEVSSFQLSA